MKVFSESDQQLSFIDVLFAEEVASIQRLSAPYVAGLFDGEGSVTINLSSGEIRPCYPSGVLVRISQKTGNPILQILQDNFGGSIADHDWVLVGAERTTVFLKMIEPFCIIKKPVIDLAIRFNEMISLTKRRSFASLDKEQIRKRWAIRGELVEINAA
jgi:hypothetical protein